MKHTDAEIEDAARRFEHLADNLDPASVAADQYGFWSHVEDDIASALDEAGRAACADHLKRLLDTGTEPACIQRQIDTLLRAVYIAQRDAGAYIALAERSGLTAKDCLAMATILAAKDDPAAALIWTVPDPHGAGSRDRARDLARQGDRGGRSVGQTDRRLYESRPPAG